MGKFLLFIGIAVEEGSLLLEVILIHDGVEVTVAEPVGIVCDLVGRSDIAFGARLGRRRWIVFI